MTSRSGAPSAAVGIAPGARAAPTGLAAPSTRQSVPTMRRGQLRAIIRASTSSSSACSSSVRISSLRSRNRSSGIAQCREGVTPGGRESRPAMTRAPPRSRQLSDRDTLCRSGEDALEHTHRQSIRESMGFRLPASLSARGRRVVRCPPSISSSSTSCQAFPAPVREERARNDAPRPRLDLDPGDVGPRRARPAVSQRRLDIMARACRGGILITVPAGAPVRGAGAEPSPVGARSLISGSVSTNSRKGPCRLDEVPVISVGYDRPDELRVDELGHVRSQPTHVLLVGRWNDRPDLVPVKEHACEPRPLRDADVGEVQDLAGRCCLPLARRSVLDRTRRSRLQAARRPLISFR